MRFVSLALACICFSMQFIFTKLFQKRAGGTLHSAVWNSILSGTVLCAVLFFMNGFRVAFSASSVLFGLLYSVSIVVCVSASVIGLSFESVGSMTFYTLLGGMILPFVYGMVFLKERPSVFRWIGFVLLIAAAAVPFIAKLSGGDAELPSSRGDHNGKRSRAKAFFCAAAVFISNGAVSIATTAAMRAENAVGENDFLLTATVIRIGLCLLMLAYIGARRRIFLPEDQKTGRAVRPAVFLLLFAICCGYALLNGAGNIFNLYCAGTMEASLQYPVISAACIVLSSLFGLLFFKERPGRGDIIGIAISLTGLVLFIF